MLTSRINAKLHAVARRAGLLACEEKKREVFKNNLLKEFSYTHKLTRSLGHPRIYQLETTNYCPYTCNMCPRTHAMTRQLGHMDIGLFRAILDQIDPIWQVDDVADEPSIGLWHFGEPMVYKHFGEAISYCHHRGLKVVLSTNPSVWTKQRISEIFDLGVDEMYVMFDGMDDDTSMAIRGRSASFQRGHASFMELLAIKTQRGLDRPLVHVSMIKQPRNAHQWKTFQEHWNHVEGVDTVRLCALSTFAADVPALITISNALVAQDSDQIEMMTRYDHLLQFPCYYPWHSITVTWDGRVVPCCRDHNAALILGDLNRQTLEAVWNGQPIQELRRQFIAKQVTAAPCVTCRERGSEIGLPGYYYPLTSINARRISARLAGSRFP
jgi:radical SAM protein with 4Fe4S-binding SPASM domain